MTKNETEEPCVSAPPNRRRLTYAELDDDTKKKLARAIQLLLEMVIDGEAVPKKKRNWKR